MKLQRLEGKLYLLPDSAPARVSLKAAGPFAHSGEAYTWMIEQTESKLTPKQSALWAHCLDLAGGSRADLAHLLAIIGLVKRNRPEEFVIKCSHRLFG